MCSFSNNQWAVEEDSAGVRFGFPFFIVCQVLGLESRALIV